MTKLLLVHSVEFWRSNYVIKCFCLAASYIIVKLMVLCLDTIVRISFSCRHALVFEDMSGEFNISLAANAKSVRQFDDGLTRGMYFSPLKGQLFIRLRDFVMCAITLQYFLWNRAVSFGFKSVDDYYFNSSSSDSVKHVRIPLLCIQVGCFYHFRRQKFLISADEVKLYKIVLLITVLIIPSYCTFWCKFKFYAYVIY